VTDLLARFERELLGAPALVEAILVRSDAFPAVQEEPERVIRCRAENLDRAIARALARAVVLKEFWRLEMAE
jgi:hypothetical protein